MMEDAHRIDKIEGLLLERMFENVPADPVQIVPAAMLLLGAIQRITQIESNSDPAVISHGPDVLAHATADLEDTLATKEGLGSCVNTSHHSSDR
jgi:hypothetical protein